MGVGLRVVPVGVLTVPGLKSPAAGGAPIRNRNARTHGRYSGEAIEERRLFAELIRESRELTEMV